LFLFWGSIADALEQDHYINEMVKKFGISEKAIRGQIQNKNFKMLLAESGETSSNAKEKPLALERKFWRNVI